MKNYPINNDIDALKRILKICGVKRYVSTAKELLEKFASIEVLLNSDIADLIMDNISYEQAESIRTFKDISNYVFRKRIDKSVDAFTQVNQVTDYLINKYKGATREEFGVLFLNSKNRLLSDTVISTGTTTKTMIDFLKIATSIDSLGANAIIVYHNHPSGENKPSEQDIASTQALKRFLKYMDVRLLDHFVLGYNDSFSFANEGIL